METKRKTRKPSNILVILIALSVTFWLGYREFGLENPFQVLQAENQDLSTESWQIFQDYLEAARTHNLSNVRDLSYQLSETCMDPESEEDCFALMDSLYNITSGFQEADFRHIIADDMQVMMYTEGPVVAKLYFTRDADGTPRVLGLQFCIEDEATRGACVVRELETLDQDGDGFWDTTESFFKVQ